MSAKRAAAALLDFDLETANKITELNKSQKEQNIAPIKIAHEAVDYLRGIYTLSMCASAAGVSEDAVIVVILFDWLRLGTRAQCIEWVYRR